MEAQIETTDELNVLTLELSSLEVEADTEFTISARLACPPERKLEGEVLEIKDTEGKVIGSIPFGPSDGTAHETDELTLMSPKIAGKYNLVAILPGREEGTEGEEDHIVHPEISQEFEMAVKPHKSSVLVWGVPSAIAQGEEFSLTVGMKCSRSCNMQDKEVGIYDHHGEQVGTFRMSNKIHEGTKSLYATQGTLTAPAEGDLGIRAWEARIHETHDGVSHSGASGKFNVQLVEAPDCTATIEVIDIDTQLPIKGATVVMHPFRASTNARGIAELRVRKGTYRIMVSAAKYDPISKTTDIEGDYFTRAPLTVEPPEDDPDSMYY